jgi:signal transduction histidine kinase/HPt (histidine-containing phosphotransfer) domain-containing protein
VGAEAQILVVEDDDLDFRQLELALRRAKGIRFRAARADSLSRALAALQQYVPDVICLDLSLPETTGQETFERVHAAAPTVPVVILTGHDDDELAMRLLESGAQDYLVKSTLAPHDLARCIRYAQKRGEVECALTKARQEAEEAARVKSAFLATMSHEIRTPLTAILGMSDLLLGTSLSDDQREYVRIFRRAGTGLLELLNNVLELSRLDSNRFEVHTQEVDLFGLVVDSLEMFAFAAHRKGLALTADMEPDLPRYVRLDGARVRQVLFNVVGNAVKFTDRGRVEVRVRPENGQIRIEVADTGPGIRPEELEQIFERFHQGTPVCSAPIGGSGLGLTLCRELLNRMGGSILAANRANGGSVFHITLPLEPTEGDRSAMEPPEELCGQSVLVVDDDPLERACYARWLARAGARVRSVGTLAEARSELSENPGYDTLVIDSRMREGGGLELAEELATRGTVPPRLVILLMMDHRAQDAARCQALGARHLTKPMMPERLWHAVVGLDPAPAEDTPNDVACLPPLRLLLAEDSPDNRTLVQAFLRDTPVELVCAETGREVVEAVEAEPDRFDGVLMDIGMPDLDGLEATRRIRRWEAEQGHPRLPIAALTAHASEADAQAARDAGCDLYVPKPFDKRALVRTAAELGTLSRERGRGCGRAGGTTAGDGPAEAANGMAAEHEDLQLEPDPEIEDLVPKYLESRAQDVETLRAAIDQGDFERVRTIGHRMKGSGGGYGMPQIGRLGATLERAGRASDRPTAEQATRDLAGLLPRIRASLRCRRPRPRGSAGTS